MPRLAAFVLGLILTSSAWVSDVSAQGVPVQGSAGAPGRAPMYAGSGQQGAATIIQDSGPASGGGPGLGLAELLLAARGTGSAPYASQGTGPYGTNWCDYDGPITSAGGYHYLCLSANAQGGGLISYGSGGGAAALPLSMIINGVSYSLPAGGGTSAVDESTFSYGTSSYSPTGCVYSSAISTLASGEGGAFSCTNDRSLYVNVNRWAGTTLAAPSAYGSAPSGQVIGANVYCTNCSSSSNPAAGATGSAVPADASYNGLNLSGNLVGQTAVNPTGSVYAAQTDWSSVGGVIVSRGAGAVGTGTARIAVGEDTNTIAGSAPGTAGSASSNVVTVQGIASGTNLAVSQATASSLNATVVQATGTNLHVVCDSGCSSSTAPADESSFTAGTTPQSPVGGFFQTTSTNNPLTSGQMGAFQVTAQRALFANLRNASGTEIGTSGTPVQVSLANTGANSTAVAGNVTQFGGSNIATGTGVGGSGIPRVTISNDSSLAANQSVNVNEIGGSSLALGSAAASASIPVVIANNQTAADPCMFQLKTKAAFGTSGATNVQIVAPAGSTKVYICKMKLFAGSAANFNVIEGTGSACTTANEAAMSGSTTAANGMALAANGGWVEGNGGGMVMHTATAGNGVCVLVSASTQFAGDVEYVQQ